MKHLKTYEAINITPEVGDYVIANSIYASKKLQSFFNSNIGQIIEKVKDVNKKSPDIILYKVYYDPYEVEPNNVILDDNSWLFDVDEILHISKNKEDLELILSANKYNL